MILLAQLSTLYVWVVVGILLFFLFGIAQFFEQRLSEKNSAPQHLRDYRLFLIPIGLFAVSAVFYLLSAPLIVGSFLADILRIIGSIILAYAGYSLFRKMMGGKS
jgi:hypothetical protein